MVTKRRSPGNTAITVSLEAGLLARIDERAKSLGLKRSTWLQLMARREIEAGGPIIIEPMAQYSSVSPRANGAADKAATEIERQVTDYELSVGAGPAIPPAGAVPRRGAPNPPQSAAIHPGATASNPGHTRRGSKGDNGKR